jgi:hypothetical protein
MAIVHHLDAQGGFTVGDTDTGRTRYAYPTSAHAKWAARNPDREAAMMIASANRYAGPNARETADYDARNWLRLNAATAPA